MDIKSDMDALWKRSEIYDIIGKTILNSKIYELPHPNTIFMCQPPNKVKTKGGVDKKGKKPKLNDVYRKPSYWENIDVFYSKNIGLHAS